MHSKLSRPLDPSVLCQSPPRSATHVLTAWPPKRSLQHDAFNDVPCSKVDGRGIFPRVALQTNHKRWELIAAYVDSPAARRCNLAKIDRGESGMSSEAGDQSFLSGQLSKSGASWMKAANTNAGQSA